MFRTSLRPIARSTAPIRQLRQVKPSIRTHVSSSGGPTSPQQSSSNLIPLLGVGAVIIGGFAYYYVPLKNDLGDRASDALDGKAKPDSLRVLADRDISTSVLDQDTLKKPIHKRGASTGATPSPAESTTPSPAEKNETKVPEAVEKKATEAKEPAQSAFNEETGEINWDCPCLGGMADGPCGEQFKAAFSCFVYSEKEPKGVECVDKFKSMQDCFREHPDVYGEEIDDDEEEPAKAPKEGVKSGEHDLISKPFDPKPVTKTPPPNSPVLATTPETTMSKGVAHLVPTYKRADKGPQTPHSQSITPPIGQGTVPAPKASTDKPDEHKAFNNKE